MARWSDLGGWIGDRGTNPVVLTAPLTHAEEILGEIGSLLPPRVPYLLISAWPTPDLRPHGLALLGHPPLMVRFPGPVPASSHPGVEVREVLDAGELAVAERVLVEGYPMPELEPLRAICLARCFCSQLPASGWDGVRALVEQIAVLTDQITEQLHAHTDAQVFTSLPCAGTIRAARLLAEIGDACGRFPTPEALASLAGVAPSTRQSGKSRIVGFRWAADRQLRDALEWAGDSRLSNPWAADIYQRARARGHDHPHAVRVLARAWVYVIWRCWQDGGAYDPTKPAGLQRLCSTPRTRGRMNKRSPSPVAYGIATGVTAREPSPARCGRL